jgi:hypothetical protein
LVDYKTEKSKIQGNAPYASLIVAALCIVAIFAIFDFKKYLRSH